MVFPSCNCPDGPHLVRQRRRLLTEWTSFLREHSSTSATKPSRGRVKTADFIPSFLSQASIIRAGDALCEIYMYSHVLCKGHASSCLCQSEVLTKGFDTTIPLMSHYLI